MHYFQNQLIDAKRVKLAMSAKMHCKMNCGLNLKTELNLKSRCHPNDGISKHFVNQQEILDWRENYAVCS
jgi:hypothetical protein